MEKEVISRKHVQCEGHPSLVTPSYKIITTYSVILQAPESRNQTIEGLPSEVDVCLVKSKIRSQNRQHQGHQLRVLQHGFRCAIETAKFLDEFLFGQCMNRWIWVRFLGR